VKEKTVSVSLQIAPVKINFRLKVDLKI